MSIAIHITTHASAGATAELLTEIRDIVTKLDEATPEGKPESTWAIYGNDFSDPAKPVKDVRIDESVVAKSKSK